MPSESTTGRSRLRPLDQLLRLWQERGGQLAVEDFLHLGSTTTGRGEIHTYKHHRSRRCLHLDEVGHLYLFEPTAGGGRGGGAFVLLESPAPALFRVAG